MRLWKKISIYFIYPASFLAMGFVLNMKIADGTVQKMITGKESEKEEEAEADEVLFNGSVLIDADTRFIVKSFDLRDLSRKETEKELPEKYIGMDRVSFLEAMEEYESSPSLEDRGKGFLSLDVERFSTEEIVIQKNYESTEKNTEFYLAVENNYIVVYEADKKTRYMSTGIPVWNLSEELTKEILGFKYIKNEAELYHFLESYSS